MNEYNLKIRLKTNGETTTLDPIQGTPSNVVLSDLSPNTDYEVEVVLQSDGGNIDLASDSESFRTLSGVDINTPFYLENLTSNEATFTLIKTGTPTSTDLSYSLDGDSWTMFDLTAATNTVEVPANTKIYLRSSTGFSNFTSNVNYFKLGMSEQFSACGNIMNLLDYNNLNTGLTSYCFYGIFNGASNLVDASDLILPATTLANYCYYGMFQSCTSLTTAPNLPATTIVGRSYTNMFKNCTSLTTAPELPATTLANQDFCYQNMFYNCTSLTTAPELPATTLAGNCYDSMFYGCTNLTTAPKLPATTIEYECYRYMFQGCTSLTTAPEMSATTLAMGCCYRMFFNCTNLKTTPELPATTLASGCYEQMFYGCTSLTTAPELPATTLAQYCYKGMFWNCSDLQSVTTYCVNWGLDNTGNWLNNAGTQATNPTIYCPADSTLKTYTDNVSGIPTGWTQVDLP